MNKLSSHTQHNLSRIACRYPKRVLHIAQTIHLTSHMTARSTALWVPNERTKAKLEAEFQAYRKRNQEAKLEDQTRCGKLLGGYAKKTLKRWVQKGRRLISLQKRDRWNLPYDNDTKRVSGTWRWTHLVGKKQPEDVIKERKDFSVILTTTNLYNSGVCPVESVL